MTSRPNILYLHSHDTGRYIQPYGYAVPTPNLQHLAEEGVLFRQAFCCNPTCSASRASLLTGQCAHSAGMLGLAHRGFSLRDYSQHLLHTLRPAGYESALAGIQHIAHDARQIGYDQILTTDPWMADTAAVAYLESRGASASPFFLSVGLFETHREFPERDPRDDPRYCRPPGPLPDTPETRRDMAAYSTSARRMDERIGRVLEALRRLDLYESTIIVSTTDHGLAFPGMKCTLHDSGLGVMMILRAPGELTGGQVVDGMAMHSDVFPTLCELLGIGIPSWVQGRSLLPMIRGDVEEVHEAVFAEVNAHAALEPMRCVRTTRWKYIRRYHGYPTPILPNCDDGESKSLWLRHGWAKRPVPQEELYELVFDPHEADNRIADPTCKDVLEKMRERLHDWMTRTDDPLLQGELPIPPNAVLDSQDAMRPS